MATRNVKIEELKSESLEEILKDVAKKRETLIVQLKEGDEIIIAPNRVLRDLPELEGFIPKGWKDAVYAD